MHLCKVLDVFAIHNPDANWQKRLQQVILQATALANRLFCIVADGITAIKIAA